MNSTFAPSPWPAPAQVADVQAQNRDRFLALAKPLIENIGTEDTVILFFIGFDDQDPDHGLGLIVYFLAPGGKSVRVQGIKLGPLVPQLFAAASDSYAADPEFRSAALVIDHGKPSVTIRRGDGDGNPTFLEERDAMRERVFPGLPLEPYRAPGR